MTEPMKTRRSWLIVPAHQPENLIPANEVVPDVTVLDLEYSVPPRLKDGDAREPEGVREIAGRNPG